MGARPWRTMEIFGTTSQRASEWARGWHPLVTSSFTSWLFSRFGLSAQIQIQWMKRAAWEQVFRQEGARMPLRHYTRAMGRLGVGFKIPTWKTEETLISSIAGRPRALATQTRVAGLKKCLVARYLVSQWFQPRWKCRHAGEWFDQPHLKGTILRNYHRGPGPIRRRIRLKLPPKTNGRSSRFSTL